MTPAAALATAAVAAAAEFAPPSAYITYHRHLSYLQSKRTMLVCDLQGMLHSAALPPRYKRTDFVIHYASRCGRCNVFGRTDRGKRGMRRFFETHRCNTRLCRLLRLDMHFSAGKSDSLP